MHYSNKYFLVSSSFIKRGFISVTLRFHSKNKITDNVKDYLFQYSSTFSLLEYQSWLLDLFILKYHLYRQKFVAFILVNSREDLDKKQIMYLQKSSHRFTNR